MINVDEIKNNLNAAVSGVAGSKHLDDVRVTFLGKKGHITEALAGLKSLAGEERKTVGQAINKLKRDAEILIAEKLDELRQKEEAAALEAAPVYDLSLPLEERLGSFHPITLVQRRCDGKRRESLCCGKFIYYKVGNYYD
jgi:phenylalanyl-tRNA synthetase alpha chain